MPLEEQPTKRPLPSADIFSLAYTLQDKSANL